MYVLFYFINDSTNAQDSQQRGGAESDASDKGTSSGSFRRPSNHNKDAAEPDEEGDFRPVVTETGNSGDVKDMEDDGE